MNTSVSIQKMQSGGKASKPRVQLLDMKVRHCRSYRVAWSGIGGRTGLMVRASDSGSGDPGSILGRVGVFVSLSKRHLLPKSTGNTQE